MRIVISASSPEREIECPKTEQNAVSRQISRMLRENAEIAQNQAKYNARLEPPEKRYEALKDAIIKTRKVISEQTDRPRKPEAFMREPRENSLPTAFDECVFLGAVGKSTMFKGQRKTKRGSPFAFKDGTEATATV